MIKLQNELTRPKMEKKKVFIFLLLFFLNISLKELFAIQTINNFIAFETVFLTFVSFIILILSDQLASKTFQKVFGFAFLFYFVLFLSSLAGDTEYGFTKAYLGLLVPFSLAAFFGKYTWSEEEILKCMTYAITIICVIGVVYKLKAGFFDRGVNYGLLGPIPFGWMSGMGFLSVVLSKERKFVNIFIAVFFFLMILWSGSKGPFIAVSVLSLLRFNSILGKKISTKIFVLGLLALSFYLVITFGKDTRVVTSMQDYIEDPEGYSSGLGKGSVGQREDYYSRSFTLFDNNPVFGVGFGGWALGTNFDDKYPHNVYLELASETGLVGLLFFAMFIVKVNINNNAIIWIGYFGLLTLMFSGDFSYFRYPLYPILMSFFIKKDNL